MILAGFLTGGDNKSASFFLMLTNTLKQSAVLNLNARHLWLLTSYF